MLMVGAEHWIAVRLSKKDLIFTHQYSNLTLSAFVDFEFHPQKSEANKAKHGIDFEEAQALWNDPDAVEIKLNYPDEERHARIAKLFDESTELWTAIFTFRSEKIRLISVRRARTKEKERYG